VSAFLATHVTVGDLLVILLARAVYLVVVGLCRALGAGQHSTDGGATRRRIEAQDAALRVRAARDRDSDASNGWRADDPRWLDR
jgi:hypothetical protein